MGLRIDKCKDLGGVVKVEELHLIKKIQKTGDHTAANELVSSYYDALYAFIKKQVTSPELALELTQDTFIAMLKTIGNFKPKKGNFKGWLYKIATNKVVDYFRSRNYHQASSTIPLEELEVVGEIDIALHFEEKELTEEVSQFLEKVSSTDQRIFRLYIFAGYTFKEIAQLEGLPESSVKSKYYRLVKVMRKEFNPHG